MTGVQTCALPICQESNRSFWRTPAVEKIVFMSFPASRADQQCLDSRCGPYTMPYYPVIQARPPFRLRGSRRRICIRRTPCYGDTGNPASGFMVSGSITLYPAQPRPTRYPGKDRRLFVLNWPILMKRRFKASRAISIQLRNSSLFVKVGAASLTTTSSMVVRCCWTKGSSVTAIGNET